jgi:hypothetical protein
MLRRATTILSVTLSLTALACSSLADPLPHSTSVSRQFIVYGSDARLRGAVCDLAERTKTKALQLLQERDAWKLPILVQAQFPQANLPELPPAHLRFSQTGSGLKLQLDLTIGADASALATERALLRAVFLEMMYREQPETSAGTALAEPPDWLLDGALVSGNEQADSQLSESLRVAPGSRIIPLDEFLRQRPALLESPSRRIYRAYSAALVTMLINMPEGRRHLARFIANQPRASNDHIAELQAHFPGLGKDLRATEKAWKLAIARFSAREDFRLLNCAETERQLAEILQIKIDEPGHPGVIYSLEEFPKFVRSPAASLTLKAMTRDLETLSGRANPLYLPVIFEYEKIAARLGRRKTGRIPKRLAEIRAAREQISRTMSGIEDYMNWFEATQSRKASGAFQEYLRAATETEKNERRRRDRISVYLDVMEAQF